MSAEERLLVEKARNGDKGAFEALYFQNRDFVLRTAARYGVFGADAEDVLQETFFYLIKKLPTLKLEAKLSTLLYVVAKNAAIDKKRGQRQADCEDEPVEPQTRESGDAKIDARRLLEKLDPLHREIIELRFMEEMALEEIAQTLGLPLGTVKSRLHNALEKLREKAGKNFFAALLFFS